MSENYNLTCPKGYGKIAFVQSKKGFFCPVSGEKNCQMCHIPNFVKEKEKETVEK
jgi:hypothetical protein